MRKTRMLCVTLTTAVSLAALLVSSPAQAEDFAKRAKAKLDDQTYQFFKDEIKDVYPDHVAAYAIVKAKIDAVNNAPYCPLRTSKCGLNPTCNHPNKKTIKTLDITIGEAVISSSDAALPKQFQDYAYFGNVALAKGDDVYLSLYVYKHQVTKGGNSHISKIKKISDANPTTKEAEAESGKTPTEQVPAKGKDAAPPEFIKVILGSSGGLTGKGDGRWISVSGDGKIETRAMGGEAASGELKPEDLQELKTAIAAVDWAPVQRDYPGRGADTYNYHLSVAIGQATHKTNINVLGNPPEKLNALLKLLRNLHKRYHHPKPKG